jgi:phosphoenolpyruvate carboxykinase (GTP)
MNQHRELQEWVEEMARLCEPDSIVWIDGSEEEKDRLTREAVQTGEVSLLNQEKLPGCLYHRTALNDVARTEDLTFICSKLREDVGPTNNWMSPEEGYRRAGEIFKGSMRGRTMYVIPFSMGPIGSPFSKIGVELTDSIYVVLNMRIMAHVGKAVLKQLGSGGQFTRCLHGKADLDINRRLILHFPEDNAIWSCGSGYGGNVLLGKKCLALRIASYLGNSEGWLAEHMLIMGVENPEGRIEYIAAAFPSACGKTNLAMLVPPEGLKIKGYRIWTVGDDIAWMQVGSDGYLHAINPEAGFFGVAPGTNEKTNSNIMTALRKNTIFTNTAMTSEREPWWEGMSDNAPAGMLDWQGRAWSPSNGPAAQANSRYTVPAIQAPSISPRWEDPAGVPISAFIFGGRRARLAPLVYEAMSWRHGVYVAATMASETTAAITGAVGVTRRDPMAMLPFCGYNMGDYFGHWLEMGRNIPHPPKIFHVNWFRKGADGKFLWPGYGENARVLKWMLERIEGKAAATETPIGAVPAANAITLDGINVSRETMNELLRVDPADWAKEHADVGEFFKKFGDRLPEEIREEHNRLGERLQRMAVAPK